MGKLSCRGGDGGAASGVRRPEEHKDAWVAASCPCEEGGGGSPFLAGGREVSASLLALPCGLGKEEEGVSLLWLP